MATLANARFQNAEHARNVWQAISVHGETLADIMNPAYWAHVARFLKPCDRIEIVAEDNSFFAELYVFTATNNAALTGLLRYEVFAENAAGAGITLMGQREYEVSFGGNFHKWRVKRLSDGEPLVSQLPSQKAAEDWLFEYRKSLTK